MLAHSSVFLSHFPPCGCSRVDPSACLWICIFLSLDQQPGIRWTECLVDMPKILLNNYTFKKWKTMSPPFFIPGIPYMRQSFSTSLSECFDFIYLNEDVAVFYWFGSAFCLIVSNIKYSYLSSIYLLGTVIWDGFLPCRLVWLQMSINLSQSLKGWVIDVHCHV